MDGGFVDRLAQNFAKPEALRGAAYGAGDRLLVPPGWQDKTPERARVDELHVGTLTGFVDYLTADVDKLPQAELIVHVKDPAAVELRSKLGPEADEFRRHVYLVATTEMLGTPFTFGQYLDAETFFVSLQTLFVRTPAVEDLLQLIASIRESNVRDTVDDGVAQEVRTGRGVTLVGTQRLPNPLTLQPYRTFREVDQPLSLFVLRAQDGGTTGKPRLALYEADGGQWKLAAIKAVREYLADKVKIPVVA